MSDSILGPYLTPEQATVLRYEGTLPPALLAELGSRLRAELGAMRTLVPEPLARDPAAFARRAGRLWAGTLLCADLSGFTALAEELTASGLIGLEELCAIINQVFGALLEELHGYGGSVLKFGGDALTCLFDAAELGPGHARAACAAALAMQRRMAAFGALEALGRTYSLRLRVGIHSGRPFAAIVGDAERREVVVVGRAVNRVAMLQEQAAPGEVMASAETVAGLPEARTTPMAGAHRLEGLGPVAPLPAPPLPPMPAGDDPATLRELAARIAELRPFLPEPLPRHVLYPERHAGGEFRPVSAVFVNVASLGGVLSLLEDMERPATALLDAYYGHIQQVVRRHGGELNKFDLSSVGDKLLITFGAPVAHDDDPQRAVEAALDMGPAVAETNARLHEILAAEQLAGAALMRTVDLALRQRIGVATGRVFAGAVGSPRRREYTVIGQVVNLAARLMAAAEPAAVVVAPTTARAVGARFTLAPLPPLALKGFAQPVAASAVLGRGEEAPAPARAVAPLVGRAHELGLLRALAPAAFGGSGRVVPISGEPGIGKSRLVGAFWDELGDGRARRVALSCSAYAQHTPYSVIRDLLTQLLELPVDAAPVALWATIEEVVGDTAPVFAPLAPLLEAVFGVAPPPIRASPAARPPLALERLPQAEQRERLHDLVAALLVGAAQRGPLALLIDDLHWADASSLELVQRLAQLAETLPLLLVLSYRPGLLPATPWAGLPHTSMVELGGLEREPGLALLGHLLEGAPEAALEPLLERAQGSPLFLEALARHLVERGRARRREGGGWQLLEPLLDDNVPETIGLVLAAQLDRLDEATRELVQVAAVIGTSINYRVLAGVYSQARQPARRLMELVGAGVLVAVEGEAPAAFRFRQTLLRDVAYQGILYAQRRELHRRVAEQIELVFGAQLERFEAELAHHYAQAEEFERACAYALRAARSSRRQHALHEALAGYAQAVAIAERHPGALGPAEMARAVEELADVAAMAGRYEQAHAHYERLLAAAEGADRVRAAVLCRKLGGVCEQQSLFDEALEWLHRARGALDEAVPAAGEARGAALELCRICSLTGWVYFRRGEPERARQWLDEALAALDTAGGQGDDLLTERARVYNRLGGVAWMLGNLPVARVYVERSLADFSALGDLLGRADTQNNLGILAEQLGDWQGAIGSYRAALEANEQSGRRRAAAMSRLNLGAAQLNQGAPEAALPLLEQATAEMRALGDALHEIMALRWLGRAQARLRRFYEAGATLSRALARAREGQLALEQLDTWTALGELALARADQAAAVAAYGEGEALLRSVERATLEAGLFLRFAARVEEQLGSAAHSLALRAESQRILSALGVVAPAELG